MKNTFNIVLICLIAVIFLPACHSSLSITKRRASKGYFVNYSSYKGSSKQTNRQEEERIESTIDLQSNQTEPLYANSDAKTNEVFQNDDLHATMTINPVITTTKKEAAISISPISEKINLRKNLQVSDNQTISKIKAKLSPTPAASGAVLSLLWIVIIILLVLWALGLIAGGWGLGGLIHILLLLAIILLILWLLRII